MDPSPATVARVDGWRDWVDQTGPNPSEMVGAEVRFRGLVSRKDLNGVFGKVKAWFEDRGRLEVRILDADGIEGESVCVKVENVQMDQCGRPGCENAGRRWCARCRDISYCGKTCQAAHSHTHRAECAALAPSMMRMIHDPLWNPHGSLHSFSDAEWKRIASECMYQDRHIMAKRMYQSMRWNISRGDVPPAVDGGAERLATAPRLNDFFVFCDFTSRVPVWSAHLTHAFYEGTDLPATYDMVGRDHLEFTLPLKTLWAKHFGADSRAGSPAGKVMMAIMRGKDAYQVFNVSLVMRDKDTDEIIPMVTDKDIFEKGTDAELAYLDDKLEEFVGPRSNFGGRLMHPKLMNEMPAVSRFKAMCDDPDVTVEELEKELDRLKTLGAVPRNVQQVA